MDLTDLGLSHQVDLLSSGSGLLAGGHGASQRIVETIQNVNLNGATSTDIMTLMQNEQARNAGQLSSSAGRVRQTPEELQETYSKLKRLTGGGVFRNGNGRLGEEIRDAVVRNENTKIENANKTESRH